MPKKRKSPGGNEFGEGFVSVVAPDYRIAR